MRILVYLAALAIFLFIVNLGAQWFGSDEAPAASSVSPEAATEPSPKTVAATTTETASAPPIDSESTQLTPEPAAEALTAVATAVEEPLSETPPSIETAVPPEAAASSPAGAKAEPDSSQAQALADQASASADPQPATGESIALASDAHTATASTEAPEPPPATTASPAAVTPGATAAVEPAAAEAEPTALVEAAAQPAVSAKTAISAETGSAQKSGSATTAEPTEQAEAPPGAIERFASNAANVAENAVDSVSSTLKSVTNAISGDDADGLDRALVPDSIAALMRRHQGQELLVLFWHPQDETVTESFEWLERMQTRYGNQGITTVSVNLASELGRSSEQIVGHGSNIEQRSDPERILARAFWVQQVPSIYLLGAEGSLLRRIEGFDQLQIGSYEDSVRQAARR